jgi:hypothetical protein
MILSFNITRDERQVAIYAGMVTSSFALAEFSASVFWGRLSDRVGRKPILLTGLAGTGISMLVFGFARNLPVALMARALGGILNGYVFPPCLQVDRLTDVVSTSNIGVLNTAVAEVVTVEAHQRMFSETIVTLNWTNRKSTRFFCHAIRLVSWVSSSEVNATSFGANNYQINHRCRSRWSTGRTRKKLSHHLQT